jgi:hypothetical protein
MRAVRVTSHIEEFGDFQTPPALAREVCAMLSRQGHKPTAILEPTCGCGTFLAAALETFPDARQALGLDISPSHLASARENIRTVANDVVTELRQADFFDSDWSHIIRTLPEPLLVIGNPPWITNAAVGRLSGSNLPEKTNVDGLDGLAALTGKSNFDISEWMLRRLLEALEGRNALLAMLCKTTVARRVLLHVWKTGLHLEDARIYHINAMDHFGVAVSACLLTCKVAPSSRSFYCGIYPDLDAKKARTTIAYADGFLVADLQAYGRWRHLRGKEVVKWRSGVKHDCARVMELTADGPLFRNGYGELVKLEDTFLYPMVKGSGLFHGRVSAPDRYMLVTQKRVGEDTEPIQSEAPGTWAYLCSHSTQLAARRSSIYRNKPRFSIFGVGDYTFARWKVGIAGLYKDLVFRSLGTYQGKPIVLDDTSYFLPCKDMNQAKSLEELLNSSVARDFFSSFIFLDSKRPITAHILGRLDIPALARELGLPVRSNG